MIGNFPSSGQRVASQRPIPIALVTLGDHLPFKAAKLAHELGKIKNQNLFSFHVISSFVTDEELGLYDIPNGYSKSHMLSAVKKALFGTGFSFGIGFTHESLEAANFNFHDEEAGVGLVTTDTYEIYNPKGRSLYQYLAYLVLCEAFCITGRKQFEHPERRFCLFDLCVNNNDIIKCLEQPSIHCNDQLLIAGFTQQDILSAEAALKYVKKTSLNQALRQSAKNPYSGFFLGALLMNILAGYIASLPTPWPLVITLVLALGFVLSVLYYLQR